MSFEETLFKLNRLKKEAEKYYQTYSKDFINIHHIKTLEEKSIQLKNTYLELQSSRQKSYEEIKKLEMELLGHHNEKKVFQEKLSEYSKENEILKNDIKILEKEIKDKNKESQLLSKKLEERVGHFTKETENLKLMHSQELFILKQKEKKFKY